MRKDSVQQVSRFGITGVAATLVHSVVLIVLVEMGRWSPTPANMIAFSFAVAVSYLGNYYWTYGSRRAHRYSILRFAFIAIVAAALNYMIFWLMVEQWSLHYLLALLVVMSTVPVISFLVQKKWVF